MAATPHALILPVPNQSHIMCLLELSYCLLDRGLKVTFLNTEFNHTRLLSTLSPEKASAVAAAATQKIGDGIRLATIPDGLGPDADRNDVLKLMESVTTFMPGYLEEFIVRHELESIEDRFTCFVADEGVAWALDISKKAGLRSVAYSPMAATLLVGNLSIPKLIEDGVIDEEGVTKDLELYRLNRGKYPVDPTKLVWNCSESPKAVKKFIFDHTMHTSKFVKNVDLIVCNTFYELEKPMFAYAPNILPIGPLLTGSRPDNAFGNFWVQDTKCIEWLDKHERNSVIYVAFGSHTVVSKNNIKELALGLELFGKPFLWVVRPDLMNKNDDDTIDLSGLIERVGDRGRIVDWCSQQQVLAHPSIACFVSHCGWNSILEGLRNGVPFLCWPYIGDQFFNQNFICDVWKVGLRIMDNEKMVFSKEEISSKLEKLIGDVEMRGRSLALKKLACESLQEGGSSFMNFNVFVDFMKGI